MGTRDVALSGRLLTISVLILLAAESAANRRGAATPSPKLSILRAPSSRYSTMLPWQNDHKKVRQRQQFTVGARRRQLLRTASSRSADAEGRPSFGAGNYTERGARQPQQDVLQIRDRAALRSLDLDSSSSSSSSTRSPLRASPTVVGAAASAQSFPEEEGNESRIADSNASSPAPLLVPDDTVGKQVEISGDVAAAGIIASSAIIFEAIQFAGTALVAYLIHQAIPEASSLEDLIKMLSGSIQQMGPEGYFAYAAIQMAFQIIPVASAFAMTVSAGVVFGSVKNGVFIVSLASTLSAAISFLISRSASQGRFQSYKDKSSQLRAIDTALADAGFFNSVLLMFLLRSSPIIPFSWANYLFGLSRVPFIPFVLGTFFGTLPGITAFVSAGRLGNEALMGQGGGLAVQGGLVATILSISLIGRISDMTLKKMNIDLEEPEYNTENDRREGSSST
mmetsp:Transcript_21696/g.35597  ORF Transcript_21696/g.35597 Transcript_21696/m.35597 type:complete len:452 (-) Transcript_21696:451-1806(-)